MKVCMFHLMPYRDLPPDFAQRYNSAYIDPQWFDVADADKVGAYYNWTLDELVYAAKAGMHGVCTNQHHQNVYGFMANPSLMGSVLAKLTNGENTAIIQIGSTLPSTSPPTRIAEEYAIIDCISGGRLVAGFPTGLPADATIANGVVPLDQRERYREALELVLKAWSAKERFAWNGKHYQLPAVTLWPRPIQQPHPPIWIPGSGISSTAEYVVEHDHCFCHLSYQAPRTPRTWPTAIGSSRPRRAGTPTPTASASCSSSASRKPTPRPRNTRATPSISSQPAVDAVALQAIPGCLEYNALQQAVANPTRQLNLRDMKFKDLVERGFVIVGSAKSVREQLLEAVKRLRIGHLMTLLHFGSMPGDLTRKNNIDLFAREVLPHLAPLWDDEWEDRWWPERLRETRRARAMAPAAS